MFTLVNEADSSQEGEKPAEQKKEINHFTVSAGTGADTENQKPLAEDVLNDHRLSEKQRTGIAVCFADSILRGSMESVLSDFGIGLSQYHVLKTLQKAHPKPLIVKKILQGLPERAPDISRLISRLEKQGYLIKKYAPLSKKTLLAQLTEKGLQLLQRAEAREADMLKPLEALTDEELIQLKQLLLKIIKTTGK